ncbi:unnamed protein product [Moneuplotes crassus]|uniref:Uncharacterized protein n=1 Tax=Euplotes crassus TaxID=5936 RepID=A0AAD1XTQ2_EUPCR|nr:unnamed protein product [Moneuplotes crassus]
MCSKEETEDFSEEDYEKEIRDEEDYIQETNLEVMFSRFTKLKCPSMSKFNWRIANSSLNISNKFYNQIQLTGLKEIQNLEFNIRKRKHLLRKFMKVPFINKINKLSVRLFHSKKDSYYLGCVIKCIPRITRALHLQNCMISRNKFRKILQIGRHMEHIEFESCCLDFKEINLTDNLCYSIQSIAFLWKSFSPGLHNHEIEETLKCIVKAASQTSLKSSLSLIKINIRPYRINIIDYLYDLDFTKLTVSE